MQRPPFDLPRALFWSGVLLLGLGGGPLVLLVIAESIGLVAKGDNALGLVCLTVVAVPVGVLCLFVGVALGGASRAPRDRDGPPAA